MNIRDLSGAQWRKSSRSGGQGGDCVEVAAISPAIAVRDSKDPQGPHLALTPATWRALTDRIKESGNL